MTKVPTTHIYTCNEGKFKVKLIERGEFIAKIELLEPIIIPTPRGPVTFQIGSTMQVGEWQVKEVKEGAKT